MKAFQDATQQRPNFLIELFKLSRLAEDPVEAEVVAPFTWRLPQAQAPRTLGRHPVVALHGPLRPDAAEHSDAAAQLLHRVLQATHLRLQRPLLLLQRRKRHLLLRQLALQLSATIRLWQALKRNEHGRT